MNKLEIEVPQSLSDITLGQYQRWNTYHEVNKDNVSGDDLDKRFVEIFCNVSRKDVNTIKATEFHKILEAFKGVFDNNEDTLIKRFFISDLEFGFEPNVEKMPMGVYTDVESHLFDFNKLHIAMGALYRPISHKRPLKRFEQYTTDDYEPSDENSEFMKQMPLDVALSAKVFFCSLGIELLKVSLQYLQEETKKEKDIAVQRILGKNGDGISHFTQLQEEMLVELKELPICQFLKR